MVTITASPQLPFEDMAKPDFDEIRFKADVLTEEFQQSVLNSFEKAFEELSPFNGRIGHISFAGSYHDLVFDYLKDGLQPYGYDFNVSISGNTRSVFGKGDYLFILQKSGASTNPTAISDTISRQSADRHILVLTYNLDSFRTKVESVNVEYRLGKTTLFTAAITGGTYTMPLKAEQEPLQEVTEHKKPRLKIKKSEAV